MRVKPKSITASFLGKFNSQDFDTSNDGTISLKNMSRVLFVGKHGSNSNTGRNPFAALRTFSNAINKAGTPTANSQTAIVCLDGGTYNENLTGKPYLHILAKGATISGTTHVLRANNVWEFRKAIIQTDGTGFNFNSANNTTRLYITDLEIQGTGRGLTNLAGYLYANIGTCTISNGYVLAPNSVGMSQIDFGMILISGTGTAFSSTTNAWVSINGNMILDVGAGAGTAFLASNANVHFAANCSVVTGQNVCNLGATDTLYITSSYLSGNYLGTGTLNRLSGIGIDDIPIGTLSPEVGNFTTITGDLEIDYLAGSTYTTVQDWINTTQSSCRISGGDISDNGDGTIAIAAGTGFIKTSDSALGNSTYFDWDASDPVALTDNSVNYIFVYYNLGTPIIQVSTTDINHTTRMLLGLVYRNGTDLVIMDGGTSGYNMTRRLERYFQESYGLQRVSGLALSETGTRNIAISAGVLYNRLNRYTTSDFDTNTGDTFTYYYRDGLGGWTEEIDSTQIDRTNYDDGTGILADLGVGNYGVHWIYMDNEGNVYILYGQDTYTLNDAQSSIAPSTLPGVVRDFCNLLGRIIIKRGANVFTDISNTYETTFNKSAATDHGELAGLADDDHLQYLLLAGRTGGQTVYGSLDPNEDLTLEGTSDAAKGNVLANLEGGLFGIGIGDPSGKLNVMDISEQLRLSYDSTTYVSFEVEADGDLVVTPSSSNIIFPSSNVGIGTDTPNAGLEISSSTEQLRITWSDSTSSIHASIQTQDDGDLVITPSTNTIFSSGNVGILNTNPNYALSITKDGGGTGNGILLNIGSENDGIWVDNMWDSKHKAFLGQGNGGHGELEVYDSNNVVAIRLSSSPNVESYINDNLGIGVTNPESLLEIKSSTTNPILTITAAHNSDYDPQIRFKTDAVDTVKFSMGVDAGDSDKFKIYSGTGVGGTSEFVINGSGYLGLGTNDPATMLEVAGDVQIGDTVRVTINGDADENGIVFGSLGTATIGIDLSSSGLSGATDYWFYNGANDYWAANGLLSINGNIAVGGGNVINTSSLNIDMASDGGHTTLDIINSGTQNAILSVNGTEIVGQDSIVNASVIEDKFLRNDGDDTTIGNITINKADPSIIFDSATATDTDFWIGVQEDALGTDNDKFQIGDGATPGTNPFVTVDTNGTVNIGTDTPAAASRLTVFDDVAGNHGISIVNQHHEDATTVSLLDFWGGYSSTASGRMASIRAGKEQTWVDGNPDTMDGYLTLYTQLNGSIGTAAVHITSDNKVGINNTSPDTLLELSKDSAATEFTISTYHDTEATSPTIITRKAEGTEASHATAVDDNAVLGTWKAQGYDSNSFANGGYCQFRVDGTPADGSMPTELVFATSPSGSETPTEGLFLKPGGRTQVMMIEEQVKTDDYIITTSDFGISFRMNSASDKTFTLPSVSSVNDGARVICIKLGSGKLTIQAADSDIIHDSGAGDTIYNDEGAGPPYPSIILEYVDAVTTWVIMSYVGNWVTTD